MQKHGFEDTTIEQICKKAKVSVGSFYNYFKSKQDVLFVVFESADLYFKDTVEPQLASLAVSDKILLFFRHYARYNLDTGLDFVKHLYGSSENKFFIAQDRFMHKLLHNILADAQAEGKLKSDMPLQEIEQYMFILARGIVNDWCLYDGSYDLEQRIVLYFQKTLSLFITK
jgi:AcrR family transcriptional regulator